MKSERSSCTAELVCAGMITISKFEKFRHLFNPETIQLFPQIIQHSSLLGKLINLSLKIPGFKNILLNFSNLFVSGLFLHFAARKYLINKICKEEVLSAKAIITIGAGFDPLLIGIQNHHPSLTLIEVDHPATQKVKIAGLSRVNTNISFIPGDLTIDKLEDILPKDLKAGDKPTIFIIEGVSMYLTESEVKNLLLACQTSSNNNCTVVLTWFKTEPGKSVRFNNSSALADKYLDVSNEQFKWGAPDLNNILLETGFKIYESFNTWELKEELGIHPNEKIASAEVISVLKSRKDV